MNTPNLPDSTDPDKDSHVPEVRLELTQAGVRQVLSLYAEETAGSATYRGVQISFADILRAMMARKGTVALSVAAGLVLALIILVVTTPLYSVTTQVVLDRQDTLESALNAGGGGSAFIATQAEIMQSRSVIEAAVATLKAPDTDADPVLAALESLQASPISGTQVVALSYLGPDPLYGAELLEATVNAYRSRLQADEQRNQAERLEAKEVEFAALLEEVQQLEETLQSIRFSYFNGSSAEDSVDARNQIIRSQQQQLQDARQRRIELESQLLAGSVASLSDDPVNRSLQDRLIQAEAELSRLTHTLKPGHPSREAAQREVALLKAQVAEANRAMPVLRRREIEALKGLEATLVAELEAEHTQLSSIERRRREEQLVMDDLEQTKLLVEQRRRALLDQKLFSRLAKNGEVGVTARLIAKPAQPLVPIWPNPLLVLALGGMIGLLAGGIWAVAKERQREIWLAGDRTGPAGNRHR